MPNWCSNKLVASGSDEAIKEFSEWLDDGKNLLSKIAPTPKELTECQSPFNGTKEESAALVAKYGFDNWYDWNIANWGTKWDVEATVEEGVGAPDECHLRFESAWGPPDRAIAMLAKQFKNLDFYLAYLEEGMCVAGSQLYEKGEISNEFYSDDPEDEDWQALAMEEFGWEPEEDEENA